MPVCFPTSLRCLIKSQRVQYCIVMPPEASKIGGALW